MLLNALLIILVFIVAAAATTNTSLVGDWEECPVNITSYSGCNLTVHALFNTNVSCSEDDFLFDISLNTVALSPPSITVINNTNSTNNSTVCRVEGNIVGVPVGYHDVVFRAAYIGADFETPKLLCEDHLLVKENVPAPIVINEPIITCDGVLIEWEALLLADDGNHDTIQYSLVVMATDIPSYTVTNTSILIPFTDGLEYDREYVMTLSGLYCGNHGNGTNVSLYTAMAPMVFIDRPPHEIKWNSTHGNVTHTIEVVRADCIVSYPKSVTITVNCTTSRGGRSQPKHQFTSITHPEIAVPTDGPSKGHITLDTPVPVDHQCAIDFTLYNGDFNSSTNTSNINTNQLQSCSFHANTHSIVSTCEYSSFSTLWGCRVELMKGDQLLNTMDIQKDKPPGFFNDLFNDVYTLKCIGLRYNPNSSHGYNHTLQLMVSYNGSSDHIRTVTVTEGRTSAAVATGTNSLSVTATVTPTPSQEPSLPIKTVLTVAVPVVFFLLFLIGICIVVICVLRKKKSARTAEGTTEESTAAELRSSVKIVEAFGEPNLVTPYSVSTGSNDNSSSETETVIHPTFRAPSINGHGSVRQQDQPLEPEVSNTSQKPVNKMLRTASVDPVLPRRGSIFSHLEQFKSRIQTGSPTVTESEDENRPIMQPSDSQQPSTDVPCDSVHPPDSTATLGGMSIVVPSRSRSYSITSARLSPRRKSESDQKNLISDDVEGIDVPNFTDHPAVSVPAHLAINQESTTAGTSETTVKNSTTSKPNDREAIAKGNGNSSDKSTDPQPFTATDSENNASTPIYHNTSPPPQFPAGGVDPSIDTVKPTVVSNATESSSNVNTLNDKDASGGDGLMPKSEISITVTPHPSVQVQDSNDNGSQPKSYTLIPK